MKIYTEVKQDYTYFLHCLMFQLNCCGATYRQFDWRYANFDPVDTYNNIIYHGENK